jgi:hypothetical protein
MNFLNPLVLFGLIAASIPIILHFLNLRRVKKLEFSTLKFLKELQRSQIRKVKLRQLLLLILRTLLIILIVLAFARPVIRGTLPGLTKYAKTSAIILVDNSPSMNYSDEYGNRFNFAKRVTKKLLDQIHSGDEAIIIDMASNKKLEDYQFTGDLRSLNEQVNKMQISYSVANISKSLNLCFSLFENSKNINKEIYIISDNQSINFLNFDSSKVQKIRPAFYFLTIGANSKVTLKNLSVDSLNFITHIFQPNKPILLNAIVHNHSKSEQAESSISLLFGNEKVAQHSFDISKASDKAIELSTNLSDEKIINGKVELQSDALIEDNTRYFGIIIPKKPKVALIEDEKNPFLLTALLYNSPNSYCETDVLSPNDFNNQDIQKYDAIIVASYTNLSMDKLNKYLSGGGKALLFPTDELKNNSAIFQKINNLNLNFKFGTNAVITKINKNNPLFEGVFLNKSEENSPDNIKINQFVVANKGIPIIETTDGILLSEQNIGSGKMIFLGVFPDTKWSNLPTSTLFPVIIYRSILYLSMLPELSKDVVIGQNAQIIIPERFAKGSNFKVVDPKGNEFYLYAPYLPSGVIISLKDFILPGNYIIYNASNEPVAIVSANLSKFESNLQPIENDKISSLLQKKFGSSVNVSFIDDFTSLNKRIEKVRTGSELWQILIILALITAIAELVVQRVMKNEVV